MSRLMFVSLRASSEDPIKLKYCLMSLGYIWKFSINGYRLVF